MLKKTAKGLAALALGVSMFTGTALADSSVPNIHKMKFERGGCDISGCTVPGGTASIQWAVVSEDSPNDVNSKALLVNVPADGSYAAAYTAKSVNINKKVDKVHNLSFEFANGPSYHTGAGAPRISVQFANGDVAYLSGYYCNQVLAVSGGDWSRADFTGAKSTDQGPCAFYVTGTTAGPGGLPYSNTPTMSAWDVYAAAHPEQVVIAAYMVFDEAGSYIIDRISFGTGFMYQSGKNIAFRCHQDESAC